VGRNTTDSAGSRGFVGRGQELSELRSGLQNALAGHGQLFLIVGEAGIGKTRLANELGLEAATRGALVLWGRCWEAGGAPVYWPWVQMLRTLVRDLDEAALTRLLGRGATCIAQLVPELHERLHGLPAPPLPSSIESEDARFPLFDAATAFFKRAAAARPLVLLLDDLHAADLPSLLLLQFVARELHDTHLLVLGTYREVDAQRAAERAEALSAVARWGHRLPLHGWSEAEVADFIERTSPLATAGAPRRAPSPDLTAAVHRTTEGNPFFVDEVVRLLLAENLWQLPEVAPAGGFRIPHGVRDAIRERLRPLSAPCREVLQAAAVIGRDFDFACLQAATALPHEPLLERLSEAAAHAIVAPLSTAALRWTFNHALIRDTLYDDLASVHRTRLHRDVGEAMERLYAANLEPHLSEVAHHFVHSLPGHDARAAVHYTVRAAQRAAAQLAYEEAALHYARALETLPLTAPADDTQRIELLLALGDAQAHAWNTPAAQASFRDAFERARAVGLPHPAHVAAFTARAALGFGGTGLGIPRGVVDRTLVAMLETALQALGDADSALRARVLARLAVELYFGDAYERRHHLAEEAVQVARRVGDRATLAHVAVACLFAQWDTPDLERRLAGASEAVDLTELVGDRDLALRAHVHRLLAHVDMGATEAWSREVDAYARLADASGQPRHQSMSASLQAMLALWMGRFEDVESLAQQALAIAQRVQDRHALVNVSVQLFALRRAQGRTAELDATVRTGVERFPDIPGARCMLALLHLDLGRMDDARREFERLATHDFADLQRSNVLNGLLAWLAELSAGLADRRRAALLYNLLLPRAESTLSLPARICFGPTSHFLGLLAQTLDRRSDAVRHFKEALDRGAEMQARPAVALTQYEYARVLLAGDATGAAGARQREALQLLQPARDTAHRFGMLGLLPKVTALLEDAGVARHNELDHESPRVRVSAAGGADTPRPDGAPAGAPAAATRPRKGGRVLSFPTKPSRSAAPTEAPVAAPPIAPAAGPLQEGIFRLDGEYWTVGDGVAVLRLKDSKGLRQIAQLLRHPDREFYVTDLVEAESSPPSSPAAPQLGRMSDEDLARLGMRSAGTAEPGEPLLDAQAKAAYRQRLDQLRDQLEEATHFNDLERAARAQQEIDFLSRELARAVGLRGRDRTAGSYGERARVNVTRAIKSVIKRIAAGHPDLGRYLSTTIKTGTFCSYTPDPRLPIRWKF